MDAQQPSRNSESITCNDSVNEVNNDLADHLHIQEAEGIDDSDGDDPSDEEYVDELDEHLFHGNKSNKKGSSSRGTSSSPSKIMFSYSSSEEEDEAKGQGLASPELLSKTTMGTSSECPSLLTVPLGLVSAMKGSREKQGEAPRKLSVTWAPNVYDPPPTNLLDVVTRTTEQTKIAKKDKIGWKDGQKVKESTRGGGGRDSSRVGGSKDKKKKQKHRTGKSSRSYGFLDDGDDY